MKEFKIISLDLKNFKGMKDYKLVADGENLEVAGRNETGKTTLFDSFTWLLFGKDSLNRSQFEIKTLNEDGEVAQHGIEHGVEGHFKVDGKPLTLKRIYMENWTKKHGESQKKFTGHTNKYYVDAEPVKQKKYEEVVNNIVSEEVFRLLTNPMYFNKYLSTGQRRETLIEIAGNVSDEEITKGNEDLEKFIDSLEGRTIESLRNIIKEKRTVLNEELDKIPVRIDELHLSMPDVSKLDEIALNNQLDVLDKGIEIKEIEIADIRSGASVNEKRKELSDIDLKLSEVKNNHGREVNDKVYAIQAKIQENSSNIKLLETNIESEKTLISSDNKLIDDHEGIIESLRNEWRVEKVKVLDHEVEDVCPTCSQDLPASQVEETKEKAINDFNQEKAEKLERIIESAKSKELLVENIQKGISKSNKEIEMKLQAIEKQKVEGKKLVQELESLKENVTDISDNKEYQALLEKKNAIEKEIDSLNVSVDESVNKVQVEITKINNNKNEIQEDLNTLKMVQSSKVRIVELEEREKELSTLLEDLDHQIYLADEYDRKKVNLLEHRINSKFKYARFKLFENQINGGFKEVCQTLYKGIPYDRGLNNAGTINVGLDIINTLSKHYGVEVPIFIDNAESVTELIDVESQTIALRVVDQNEIGIVGQSKVS